MAQRGKERMYIYTIRTWTLDDPDSQPRVVEASMHAGDHQHAPELYLNNQDPEDPFSPRMRYPTPMFETDDPLTFEGFVHVGEDLWIRQRWEILSVRIRDFGSDHAVLKYLNWGGIKEEK